MEHGASPIPLAVRVSRNVPVQSFAFELARSRQLSGAELAPLAQRMVDSNDPAEIERLEAELTRGFYGE